MQEIVDANEPFETITALERAYPPAHGMCRTKAGQSVGDLVIRGGGAPVPGQQGVEVARGMPVDAGD
jgi:hypothetical protein